MTQIIKYKIASFSILETEKNIVIIFVNTDEGICDWLFY